MSKLGASVAAYDHRLASAVVTLREKSDTNGFVNGHKMLHNRWVPSITPGAGNSLDQLITMGGVDLDLTQFPKLTQKVSGDPVRVLAEFAHQHDIDVLVMGRNQSRGLEKLIGSTTEHLLYQASCSILAV